MIYLKKKRKKLIIGVIRMMGYFLYPLIISSITSLCWQLLKYMTQPPISTTLSLTKTQKEAILNWLFRKKENIACKFIKNLRDKFNTKSILTLKHWFRCIKIKKSLWKCRVRQGSFIIMLIYVKESILSLRKFNLINFQKIMSVKLHYQFTQNQFAI